MCLAAQISGPYDHSNIPAWGQLVWARKECHECWDVALNCHNGAVCCHSSIEVEYAGEAKGGGIVFDENC